MSFTIHKNVSCAVIALFMAVSFVIGGISGDGTADAYAEESVSSEETDIFSRLSALDDVSKVEQIEPPDYAKENNACRARYMIEFTQPIDWNDPDLGSFSQRVFLGYKGTTNVNCIFVGGYALVDMPDYYGVYKGHRELTDHYDANIIDIEYRFYGESVPEGFSIASETYVQYLNSENASKDFDHIITELGKVLTGKTLFTGASKGGNAVESMAYYYPEECDAYISYVAPFCNGIYDTRIMDFVYTSIGDRTYGTETADQYRKDIIEIEKLLLDDRYRDAIQGSFINDAAAANVGSPLINDDEAYEIAVVESGLNVWQYDQDFATIESVLNMPENTENEISCKAEALKEWLYSTDPVEAISCTGASAVYYIEAYSETGNYAYDLSYLRSAGANVKTPEENEKSLAFRAFAPTIYESDLQYSSAYQREMTDFFNTTDTDIIKILGSSDPWYAAAMADTDNPHIHIFEVEGSHESGIDTMTEEQQAEVYGLIDTLIK